MTTPELRREITAAWVRAATGRVGGDAEKLADTLAAVVPSDPMWAEFEGAQLRHLQDVWSWVDLNTYGAVADPRVSGPNEEAVMFVDTTDPALEEGADGMLTLAEHAAVRGKSLLMRYYEEPPDPGVTLKFGDVENGWRVAATRNPET